MVVWEIQLFYYKNMSFQVNTNERSVEFETVLIGFKADSTINSICLKRNVSRPKLQTQQSMRSRRYFCRQTMSSFIDYRWVRRYSLSSYNVVIHRLQVGEAVFLVGVQCCHKQRTDERGGIFGRHTMSSFR